MTALPRIIAACIFFDESPIWLSAMIASLAKIPVDHLVICDGAFVAYPHARARSGVEQHQAIFETCAAIDIGLTLHVPEYPWETNEVGKRSYAFQLAEHVAEPFVDWYYVADADEIVTAADLVPEELAATELDVAMPVLWQRKDPHAEKKYEAIAQMQVLERESRHPVRKLFRAIPGLRVVGNHWTYMTPDGRKLMGSGNALAPALPLPGMRVEHREPKRDLARRRDQMAYYALRDKAGLEELDVDNHQAERLAEVQAAAR